MEHVRSVSVRHQSKLLDDRVLASLRETYRRRIEELVDDLGPQLRSGELRGFRTGDGEGSRTPPLWALEDACRARVASTDADVFAALALSDYTGFRFDSGCTHPAFHAGAAAAVDVLKEAARRGWYRPDASLEEHPSLQTLDKEAGEPLPDPFEDLQETAVEGSEVRS